MLSVLSVLGKPLFEMCCFHMGIVCKGRGACQDGSGHSFPRLPGGVRACQDGLGHFFLRLPVRKRWEGSKAMPI